MGHIRITQEGGDVAEAQVQVIDLVAIGESAPGVVRMLVDPPRAGRQGLVDQVGDRMEGVLVFARPWVHGSTLACAKGHEFAYRLIYNQGGAQPAE